jgi:hypothetical protein
VSFDFWTSPNSKAFVGVVFHFLDKDLKVRSLLVGMKRIKELYINENIIKVVISIIKTIISSNQLGFFIGDNIISNNTAIRAILVYLRLDLKDLDSRRVRCLSYIINLAAKAFLFGKDADAFCQRKCRMDIRKKEKNKCGACSVL